MRVTVSILTWVLLGGFSAAAPIRVGVAVADITPPTGINLWGYSSRVDPATGILDRLFAKAVVFDDGKTLAAIVSLDLGRTFPDTQTRRLRRLLEERYGLAQSLIAATHTHAAPRFGASEVVDRWTEETMNRIVQLVGEALENRKPARFFVSTGSVDITYDRRVVNPDGSVTMLWNNFDRKPTTTVDQAVRVLFVKDESDRLLATLVHYACHPVMGGSKNHRYTADFPGPMCSYIDEKIGGVSVYLQGACGNINPYLAGILSDEGGYDALIRDGHLVGQEVVRLYGEARPLELEDARIRYRNENSEFQLRYPVDDERVQSLLKGLNGDEWLEGFQRQESKTLEAETSILMLGDSLAWAGFPGEFFDEFQQDLRRRSPIAHTFFVGYCNGYLSYFPTIQAAAEGGYGADYGLLVETGAGEHLVNRVIINLYSLLGLLEGK